MATLLLSLIAVPNWLAPVIVYGIILLFILIAILKNKELKTPDGRLFCLMVIITLINLVASGLGSIPWDGNSSSEM